MHLPEIDRYSQKDGPLNRIDPRIKLLSLGLILLAVNLTWHLKVAGLFLGISIVMLSVSGLPLNFVLWHLRAPAAIALLIGGLLSISSPGKTFGSPTPESLALGLTVILKVLSSFIFFLSLVGTSPLFKTIRAARSLGVPEKLLALFIFTYRYVFVLLDDFGTLKLAMIARGFREKTNFHTYRLKARLYALLLWRAYEETEKVLLAMYARGLSSLTVQGLSPIGKDEIFTGIPLLGISLLLLGFSIFW